MIYEALEVVVKEINDTIAPGVTNPPLSLANVARVNDGDQFTADFKDKLVLSVVNIEEERISKTPDNYFRENNKINYRNPPFHLNLTLLFAATHDYKAAIPYLEQILLFFQVKSVFTPENTPALEVKVPEAERLIFEMVSLNLEQVHQLWSTLGGHYMPSVVFKLRMLTILKKQVQKTGEPITEINLESSIKN